MCSCVRARVCVCARVRACVRAFVRACVRACVCVCERVCVSRVSAQTIKSPNSLSLSLFVCLPVSVCRFDSVCLVCRFDSVCLPRPVIRFKLQLKSYLHDRNEQCRRQAIRSLSVSPSWQQQKWLSKLRRLIVFAYARIQYNYVVRIKLRPLLLWVVFADLFSDRSVEQRFQFLAFCSLHSATLRVGTYQESLHWRPHETAYVEGLTRKPTLKAYRESSRWRPTIILIRTRVPVTSMSDHYPVCCTLSCQIPKAKAGKHTTVAYRSYKHFDAGSFLCDLSSASFDAIYGLSDPDEALAHFYKLFLHVYDKYVPIRRQRVKISRCLPGSQLTFNRLWNKGADLRSRKTTLNLKSKEDMWNI